MLSRLTRALARGPSRPGAFSTNLNIQRRFAHNFGLKGGLTKDAILQMSSTPSIAPSYPKGPYRFRNREYFIIEYESDPAKIRKIVPEPLKPIGAGNKVLYEFIKMPDSTGFGSYTESGVVIPCMYKDTPVNYTAAMFLNDEPPIACGAEVWGFPKKFAEPTLSVHADTLVGQLTYQKDPIANASMAYKWEQIPDADAVKSLGKTQVNFKIIHNSMFEPEVAQLVAYELKDIELIGAWKGPARLDLHYHVNSPMADLPVRKMIGGSHLLANITLPYGRVLHDYIKDRSSETQDLRNRLHQGLSMPMWSPSFVAGPLQFDDRTMLMIKYTTDPNLLVPNIPEDLYVNPEGLVYLNWVKTESTAIGAYTKAEVLVPCKTSDGRDVNFNMHAYCNNSATINYGRQILGIPFKHAHAELSLTADTVKGTLTYGHLPVATATAAYKIESMAAEEVSDFISTPMALLKFIPSCKDGSPEIAQLTLAKYGVRHVNEAWRGAARVQLYQHARAPLADHHVIEPLGADYARLQCSLIHASVLRDYLKKEE